MLIITSEIDNKIIKLNVISHDLQFLYSKNALHTNTVNRQSKKIDFIK